MSRQSARISADPKKVNSELFTLTYGALVNQLVKDSDGNVEEVNKNLERIGYNIGMRIIEDYLARSGVGRCTDLKETADKVTGALRLYTNLSPSLSINGDEFSLTFETSPFAEFAELPDNCLGLKYANLLPGVIRGACEMVQMEVFCWIEKRFSTGKNHSRIR